MNSSFITSVPGSEGDVKNKDSAIVFFKSPVNTLNYNVRLLLFHKFNDLFP